MNDLSIKYSEENISIFWNGVHWRDISNYLYMNVLRKIPPYSCWKEFVDNFSDRENKEAKMLTLNILSKKSCFTIELFKKLKERGFSDLAVNHALEYAERIGALSDEKKIMYYIEKAMQKGRSENWVRSSLKIYQLDEVLIDKCFSNYPGSSKEVIRSVIEKKWKWKINKDPRQKKKMIHYFLRKGFRYEEITAAQEESE